MTTITKVQVPATGASNRKVSDKLAERISVDDFASGDIGDGVTDASPAFTLAVAYAKATTAARVGSAVEIWLVPGKTYLLNSTVGITGSNIRLCSNGATILNGQNNAAAVYFGDGVTRFYGNGVQGINFGSKNGSSVVGSSGLYVKKQAQFNLTKVLVSSAPNALYRGVTFDDVSQYSVIQLEIQNCVDSGLTLLDVTDGRYGAGCRSDGNGNSGVLIQAAQGHIFQGFSCYNNTSYGWNLTSPNPAVSPNVNNWFFGCIGDTSGKSNWLIQDLRNSYLVACWGATQQSTLANTGSVGFFIESQYCKELYLITPIAQNNNSHGIQINAAVSAPTGIHILYAQLGTASAGNGKSGSGYGLYVGGAAITGRAVGGAYASNTSGAVSNNSIGDFRVVGYPLGYTTMSRGSGTVAVGTSSTTITHGLSATPSLKDITVTFGSDLNASGIARYWLSNFTATTFQINVNANVATVAWSFGWTANIA